MIKPLAKLIYKIKDKKSRKINMRKHLYGEQLTFDRQDNLMPLFYKGSKALIVEIHGGGFACGNSALEDAYCEYLRRVTGYSVLSCDYTLSYTAPYPKQIEDCERQIAGIIHADNHSYENIVLIGHSAGGNLAASICARNIKENKGYKFSAVCLNYPWLNLGIDERDRFKIKGSLSVSVINEFKNLYAPKTIWAKSEISPINLDKTILAKFPPTYITACSQDSLKDDAIAFADKLSNVGVITKLEEVDTTHGFIEINMRNIYKKPHDENVLIAKSVTDNCINFLKSVIPD